MNSIVQFPLVGLYREDAEMGRYMIDDEEHDALELAPIEAFPLYMNLRRRMDFATGVVGGKKRRISWLEVSQWLHRDSARGRKAVTASVSKARRLVGQMVKVGLLEYRTDRQEDYLMFFLPLAYSDASEALKKEADAAAYHREVEAAIAESENCISIDRFRQRDGTTGTFLPGLMDAMELPLPTASAPQQRLQTPEITAQNTVESRQTFDSPEPLQADRVEITASHGLTVAFVPESEETRQTSDRVPEAKTDNNNPFTPIHHQNSTNTQSAGARDVDREEAYQEAYQRALTALEGMRLEDEARREKLKRRDKLAKKQAAMAKKGKKPKRPVTHSVTPQGIKAPEPTRQRPLSPLIAGLSPELETLAVDESTGFAMQISPALRRKAPQLVKDLQNIVSDFFAEGDRA